MNIPENQLHQRVQTPQTPSPSAQSLVPVARRLASVSSSEARVFDTIDVPPAAGGWVKLKLALTLGKAVPMVAGASWFARPGPGVVEGAMDSERNTPRQPNVKELQDKVVVSEAPLAALPLLKAPEDHNNRWWLTNSHQGLDVVFGSGFFGMYQHAGAMLALDALDVYPHITKLAGVSSGAITVALRATRGPAGMVEAMMNLSLLDFLDLSIRDYWTQGAVCAGQAVKRKIAYECELLGNTRIETTTGPDLCIGVFDGLSGNTVWRKEGNLAESAAQSAALPVLFANDGQFIDGGWIDHHGLTALTANKRGLSVRMNTSIEPDAMQKLVKRPVPLFNVSQDPKHKTVCLKPQQKIDGSAFLFDIDFRKQKLADIITESKDLMTRWLYQPA